MTGENMPQTKKENPDDGLHFFNMDVQNRVQERGAAFISETTASMWEHITLDERSAYEQDRNKQNLGHVDYKNKFRLRRRYCAYLKRLVNPANRAAKCNVRTDTKLSSQKPVVRQHGGLKQRAESSLPQAITTHSEV